MKKLLLLLSISLTAFAQSYPSSVYTPLIAKDNVQTTLSQAMAVGDTTAFVASTTGWQARMIAYICEASSGNRCTSFEVMLVTAVPSSNALTVTRGYGGTSAIAHASGKTVSNSIASIYNKTLSDEVFAIETALGPNLSNISSAFSPIYRSAAYNFTPQAATGNLAIGANSILFGTLPSGLAIGNYLRISGGVGTDESVPITGISGSTVFVTCAGTHTGAWTIGSDSAGVQEAVVVAQTAGGGIVFVSAGTILTAGINVTGNVQIQGAGMLATTLQARSATQAFTVKINLGNSVTPANGQSSIRGINFYNSGPATAGAAVVVTADGADQNNFTVIEGNRFYGQFVSTDFQKAAYWTVRGNQFHPLDGYVIKVANTASVDSGDQLIEGNWIYGGLSGLKAIYYQSGGGLRVIANKILGQAGTSGLVVEIPSGVGTGQLQVIGNSFDGCGTDSIIVTTADATGTLPDHVITGNHFNGSPTHAHIYYGPAVGSTMSRIIISGNDLITNTGTGVNIWLHTGANFMVGPNMISSPSGSGLGVVVDSGVSNSVVALNPTNNTNVVNNSTSTIVIEALQPGQGGFSPGFQVDGKASSTGVVTQSLATNYIGTESGSNNAVAFALADAKGVDVPLAAGLCFVGKLAHTLQAGANTVSWNGTAKNLKSHLNAANNIGTAYAATGFLHACYDGTQFLDMSQ